MQYKQLAARLYSEAPKLQQAGGGTPLYNRHPHPPLTPPSLQKLKADESTIFRQYFQNLSFS